MSRRRAPRLLAPLVVAAALAGCASPAPVATSTPDALDLRNCDTDVSISSPPERVVAIKSTAIELLLALGLGDRIVGTAFADGPVPEPWAADAADLPVLSDFMPSEEAVLEVEPDLVIAGWESAFAADAAGERAELARLGIATYVQPAACRSEGAPARLDFDEVFREIEEVAAIFDVDASALVADQRARLAAITPDDRGLTALWYSSGTDTPYVGAGTGAPQMVMDAVGLSNIASDIDMTWSTLGWEAIVAADPDVIVLVDADWNTAASKIEMLEQNPATAELSAVRAGRYLVLPFAATEAGVRSVAAAERLAEQLRELDAP